MQMSANDYMFDYQSNRHCAKTVPCCSTAIWGLITSQIDTAPKLGDETGLAVSV